MPPEPLPSRLGGNPVMPAGEAATPDGMVNPVGSGLVTPEGIKIPGEGPLAPVGIPVASKRRSLVEVLYVGGSAVPEKRIAGGAPLWVATTFGDRLSSAVTQGGGTNDWLGDGAMVVMLLPIAEPCETARNSGKKQQVAGKTVALGHGQVSCV